MQVRLVGSSDARVFGVSATERLARQAAARPVADGLALCLRDGLVLNDSALDWFIDTAPVAVVDAGGQPLVVCVPAAELAGAAAFVEGVGEQDADWSLFHADQLGERYVRKLRRRVPVRLWNVASNNARDIERELFQDVYKGVTDLVTRYAWPMPAFWLCRVLGCLGIRPNTVTIFGLVLTLVATMLFWQGHFVEGLCAAWAMTFLDTVDGKLARVTVTSSKIGNLLDHGNDIIHPPFWWASIGYGAVTHGGVDPMVAYLSTGVILAGYVFGRLLEGGFKRQFGINPFTWRRFDSVFRLIVARRNILLLLITAGVVLSDILLGLVLSAAWYAISIVIQIVRCAQGGWESSGAGLKSWMA